MARVDAKVISQWEDLLDDPIQKCGMIAAWKIRPPDGACKEGVTREDSSCCLKADPTRRVSGGVNDLEGIDTHLDFLTLIEVAVRLETESRSVQAVDQHRGLCDPLEFRSTTCVVHMTVGDENIFYLESVVCDFFDNAEHFIARIDNQAVIRFFAPEHVTVCLVGADHYFSKHTLSSGILIESKKIISNELTKLESKCPKGLSASGKKPRLKEGVNEFNFFPALEQNIDVNHPCDCAVHRCRTMVSHGLYKIHRVNPATAFLC